MIRVYIRILIVSLICFLVGGGWHFLTPSDEFIYGLFYRLDTEMAELWAWTMLFLFCGPAAAIAGASITTIIYFVRRAKQDPGTIGAAFRSRDSGNPII
jgi:hypothetical protein